MPYITYAERVGHEQGMARGRQEGLLDGIAAVLEVKFGELGLTLMPEIRLISDAGQLQSILANAKVAASPDDVRAAIAQPE